MPDFNDFAPLYDSSLIEKAVQAFFCADALGASFVAPADDDDPKREDWTAGAGNIAFYTAFQALTFQQCRPRVWIDDFSYSVMPDAMRVDVNNVLRPFAWSGRMKLGIITEPNFKLHTALRARVAAIIPQLQPTFQPDGSGIAAGGVNQYLQFHEIAKFSMDNVAPAITPQTGYYLSPITINLTFGVRATAWPAA